MAFGPITSWQIDGKTMKIVTDFIFLDSKITADGDCSGQSSSVTQSCPTLCDPTHRSTPGLPVHHSWSLPKPMSIESVMPSHRLIFCRPLLLLPTILPSIRIFSMSQLFTTGGQSIGVSASTSVLPMNTQN